jgi:hypothetical protein
LVALDSLAWPSFWPIGNRPPHRQSFPQSRVEVVEGRVCLYFQGVKQLAEEAAGRCMSTSFYD